ncbi:MAG: xanthine dehydrogenase family protein subunit M [Planctomycetes bacterium]|nr:xanthine dehydrogenase family protein subunit M [Planctomycetota bacterium]
MRAWLPGYDLLRAKSLDAALRILADGGGETRVFAGGTDLMVLLESGDLPPGRFVSVWGLPELSGISVTDAHVTLGALTTYTEIQAHPVLRAEYPMLCEAARLTGATAIQNRGTIGGNIVNASPAADSPPALLVYGAEVELISAARGARWVGYDGFHTGYKRMDRRPDELLRAVRLPRTPGGSGAVHFYRKVGTRGAQAISKVMIAALGRRDAAGVVADCRISLGSVAPIVLRCRKTEAVCLDRPLTAEVIAAARAAVMDEVTPIDDIRSTKAYRRVVSGNLVAQFLALLAK